MKTLTQLQFLDRDSIMPGVNEWIVEESPLLGVLPQKPIQGNSLLYNVELTLPTAAWTTVGTQLSENTGTVEQRTTNVYTLIQTSLTDKSQIVLNATQNPEMIDIQQAAKAMAHRVEKTFIVGRTSVDTNNLEFKGLLRTCAELESATTTDLDGPNNSQVIALNAASGALTMVGMDELLDQIKPGKASMLLMSRWSRRKLNVLSRATQSSGLEMYDDALFGLKMHHYDGVPIYVSDWILDNYNDSSSSVLDITAYDFNTARASGYDNTVIMALKIGEGDVTALAAGSQTHERATYVEDYNAIANRFVWYTGMACFKKYSLAIMTGVKPDD